MEHTNLGRTGLVVSRICLGTMTFGLQCDEATSVAILDAAAEAGVTFIDTADVYPLGGGLDTVGRTEEIVGRWLDGTPGRLRRGHQVLRAHRADAVGPGQQPQAHPRRRRRLAAPPADRLHRPLPAARARPDARRSTRPSGRSTSWSGAGKVRYVGCSNFLAYQVARAIGRSEVLGLVRFVSVQPRYNLLFRQPERELFPFCEEEGLGVIPYNPLAGGLLTGKYEWSESPPTTGRFALGTAGKMYVHRYWHEHELRRLRRSPRSRPRQGTSPARIALGWVAADPVVSAVIIGASRPEQLADTLDAVDVPMAADLKARLDELTVDYRKGDAPK